MSEATHISLDAFLARLRQIPREQRGQPQDYLADAKKATRILVVEDDEPVRSLLEARLERWGYPQVSAVDNGDDAMDQISKHQADILISDGQYPPDGCIPVVNAAIRSYGYTPLRIMILTGMAHEIQQSLNQALWGIADIAENQTRRQNDSSGAYRALVPVFQKPPTNGILNTELDFILSSEVKKALAHS